MKKVKRGSSLVSVLVVAAVLILIGTAVLSLTVADYRSRLNESNRVQNLYEAESGLDEAYGIIGKLIEESINDSNKAVEDSYGTITEEDLKNDDVNQKLNGIFKANYKTYIIDKLKFLAGNSEGIIPAANRENPPKVVIIDTPEDIVFNDQEVLLLDLESNFFEINPQGYKNERMIRTTFKITAPEYENAYYHESTKMTVSLKNIVAQALYAEKSMYVNESADVNGDIFIRGIDKGIDTNFDSNGIILSGTAASLTSHGDIITGDDIMLYGSGTSLKSEKEDGKIFTGSLGIGNTGTNSQISVSGKVYANNDLILNAASSKINIGGGYYGFNDITTSENYDGKRNNSSSIIVNTEDIGDKSSITIKNEAMLMGTAYIRTTPIDYQTGESVAVKGNYRAYASELNTAGDFNKGNVKFEYWNPLYLVTKFKNDSVLMIEHKSEYFRLYANASENRDKLRLKGIILPVKTVSTGSTIKQDQSGNPVIDKGNVSNEDVNKATGYRNEYLNKLASINSFSNEVNLSMVSQSEILNRLIEGRTEVIYIGKGDAPLYIRQKGTGSSEDKTVGLEGGRGKGIIVYDGDIYIEGNIDFIGTIITSGNIFINGDISIKNDLEYLKVLLAEKYSVLKEIFKGKSRIDQEIEFISTTIDSAPEIGRSWRNNITTINWKLVK